MNKLNYIKGTLLDDLFLRWEQDISIYKDRFIKDGIIDEELYDKASVKILFIGKEANDPGQSSYDYREWWREELKYSFALRISEWSFGILNDFPQYDEIWKTVDGAHKALKQIAFLNIKKSGGNSNADYDIMLAHLGQNLAFLHQQIEIIAPDIIIIGTTWKELRNGLFPEVTWTNSGFDIQIGKHNNAKVVDFYHPSSRTPPAASYCLLKNVLNSDQFIDL